MTTKAPFLFPVRAGDIALFCHPDPDSPLHHPHYVDGDLTAGNGHIAIRAKRGPWVESDFPPPPYEALERFGNLPWHRIPGDSPEWRALDDIRGMIYAHATVSPYMAGHKPTPCPVWQIGGHHLARLSHLQLIARLPRVLVWAGPAFRDDPLFFKYNGGTVIMPKDSKLTTYSRKIFTPATNALTGNRLARSTGPPPSFVKPPPPEPPLENWPPPEPSDD